jgi:hypothetical protein
MSAYNYEFWHAGGERVIKNDEGEINDVELFTPYPWEALGMLEPNQDATVENEDGGVYKAGQTKLWLEPRATDQVGLPRHMVMRGYLGDMRREMIVLPKFTLEEDEAFVDRLSSPKNYTGLLDIHQHSDGRYTVRSAKGITHEKYLYIPVPKRVQEPEQADTLGDGLTNYKPSGYYGDGQVAIHGKQEWDWSEKERPDTWAAELYDAHAYIFNWYGIKPLVAHEKDFRVPEEGVFGEETPTTTDEDDETVAGTRAAYVPNGRLAGSFMFPLPTFAEVQIDHRTGTSRYYYTRSVISQLPDGSVLIEDGYGSSIHMTGGNIFTSCAGDAWTRTGRSVIHWAGDDYIARAGSSMDLTTSNGDLRLQAEKNLHMRGGNSGVDGGIIVENRAVYGVGGAFVFRDGEEPVVGEDVKTYGIIFKSAEAPLMIYGKDVYTRAIRGLAGGGRIVMDTDGEIVESAGLDITQMSRSGVTHILGQSLADGDSVSGSSVVNRFDVDNTVFSGTGMFRAAAQNVLLDTDGGAIYAKGLLGISQGVQPFPPSAVENLITQYSADYTGWLQGTGSHDLPTVLAGNYALVYTSGIMGDSDFIDEAGFTCRNADQYNLFTDFFLTETRWQQMYRSKEIGLIWFEPQVLVPGSTQATRPHPGNNNWLYAESFAQYTPELWDDETGRDTDRGKASDESHKYDTVRQKRTDDASTALKKVIMSDNYLVSEQIAGIPIVPEE